MKYYSLFIVAATALILSSCGILNSKPLPPLEKPERVLGKGCKSHTNSDFFGWFRRGNPGCDEDITHTVTEVVQTAKGSEVVTREIVTPAECPKCNTSYRACSKSCGRISDGVVRRASAQGWNGNPHIGLIPTMKVLAE